MLAFFAAPARATFTPPLLDAPSEIQRVEREHCAEEKIWFDARCRGALFFSNLLPAGEELVGVSGNRRGTVLAGALVTAVRDEHTVVEYAITDFRDLLPDSIAGAEIIGGGPTASAGSPPSASGTNPIDVSPDASPDGLTSEISDFDVSAAALDVAPLGSVGFSHPDDPNDLLADLGGYIVHSLTLLSQGYTPAGDPLRHFRIYLADYASNLHFYRSEVRIDYRAGQWDVLECKSNLAIDPELGEEPGCTLTNAIASSGSEIVGCETIKEINDVTSYLNGLMCTATGAVVGAAAAQEAMVLLAPFFAIYEAYQDSGELVELWEDFTSGETSLPGYVLQLQAFAWDSSWVAVTDDRNMIFFGTTNAYSSLCSGLADLFRDITGLLNDCQDGLVYTLDELDWLASVVDALSATLGELGIVITANGDLCRDADATLSYEGALPSCEEASCSVEGRWDCTVIGEQCFCAFIPDPTTAECSCGS